MWVIEVVVGVLALYGLYRLVIKVFGEKEVDDEITAIEKKIEDKIKK
jgi:hypothetical protein